MVTSGSVAGAAGFIPAATLALLGHPSSLGVTLNQSHPLGRVEQGRESRRIGDGGLHACAAPVERPDEGEPRGSPSLPKALALRLEEVLLRKPPGETPRPVVGAHRMRGASAPHPHVPPPLPRPATL